MPTPVVALDTPSLSDTSRPEIPAKRSLARGETLGLQGVAGRRNFPEKRETRKAIIVHESLNIPRVSPIFFPKTAVLGSAHSSPQHLGVVP